jgi:hypothetical protein
MNDTEYKTLIESLPPSVKSEAEDLLLQTIYRYKPLNVGLADATEESLKTTIDKLKGLLKVTAAGYVKLCAAVVKAFIIEYHRTKYPELDPEVYGHTLLAKSCLDELRSRLHEAGCKCLPTTDPLSYAIRFWPNHVRASSHPGEFNTDIYHAFSDERLFENWRTQFLLHPPSTPDPFKQHDPLPNSLLEVALSFGLSDLTTMILSQADLTANTKEALIPPNFQFPNATLIERLYYCVAQTNDESAYISLRSRLGKPPAQPQQFGALSRAILGRNWRIVRALLADGVDPMWPGRKPLTEKSGEQRQAFWPNVSFFQSRGLQGRRWDGQELVEWSDYGELEDDHTEEKWRNKARKYEPLTPVWAAIRMDDVDALRLMNEYGATANWEALLNRVTKGGYRRDQHGHTLKYIIHICDDTLWTANTELRTRKLFLVLRSLILGCWHEGVIKEVLSLGADPNADPIDDHGQLVSTPLFDAFKYMASAIRRDDDEYNDKSMRQHVEARGQTVRYLLEAGAKIDIYTRAFVRSHPHLQIVVDGVRRGDTWGEILAEFDNEYADESWVVVKKSMIEGMEMLDVSDS